MSVPTTGISVQGISILDATTGRASGTQLLTPADLDGRRRVAEFRIQWASQTQNTSYVLTALPRGARLFGGQFRSSVALGGTMTVAIGLAGRDNSGYYAQNTVSSLMSPPNAIDQTDGVLVADSTGVLLAAAVQNVTTIVTFNDTAATLLGYRLDKDCIVTMTLAASANAPASGLLIGHINYVTD